MDARQTELVKSLFKMLWADGVAEDKEIDVVSKLLDRIGLPWAEKMRVMDQRMTDPTTGDDGLDRVCLDEASRLEALELLITVGFSDGHFAEAEMHIIGDLAVRWGVSAEQLEQLRQKAMRTLSGGQ